jgi:phage shock protein PspC (stress-responsive transcriptional regulator)
MQKKLRLSASDKKLAGVCGGLAEYFGFSATILRVIWACLVIFGGTGILLYLICWIVFPAA